MKKYFIGASAILMIIVFLTACGSGVKEIKATTEEILSDIQSQIELEPMYENDGDYIYNYYGIEEELLEEFVFLEAEDGLKVETLVLMKVKEEASVEEIIKGLETLIDQRKNTMNNYIPDQYEIACEAVLESQGKFVYLVISKDVNDIQKIIESYTK